MVKVWRTYKAKKLEANSLGCRVLRPCKPRACGYDFGQFLSGSSRRAATLGKRGLISSFSRGSCHAKIVKYATSAETEGSVQLIHTLFSASGTPFSVCRQLLSK